MCRLPQVVPNPYRANNRLNKEFRDLVAKQPKAEDITVSYAMMEGYVNAKVLVEAMCRTQPLNSERLADSLVDECFRSGRVLGCISSQAHESALQVLCTSAL